MPPVEICITAYYPDCCAAEDLLAEKGVTFTETDDTGDEGERARLATLRLG